MTPTRLALDRHHARRRQGVPTVSVLAGPVGLGQRAWREWAADRPVARADDPAAVPAAWAAAVPDPTPAAARWAGLSADRLARMTRYDLEQAWRSLPIDPTTPTAAAAFRLLEASVTGRPADPSGFTIAGVGGLLPADEWPVVLAVDPPGGLTAYLRGVEPLVAASPELAIGIAVSAEAFDAAVARTPPGRAEALAREGHVPVVGVSADELRAKLAAAGAEPPPSDAALARRVRDGLTPEAADQYAAAVAAGRRVRSAADQDEARSRAERALFEQLESHPETAGQFRLNQSLEFRHGPKPAEADLLAKSLKLVVEVDGAFYHLREDRYRPDRRKDWLYQKHGYLVLRFLDADVTDDMPDGTPVLDVIREAVAHRRGLPPPADVSPP